MKDAGARENQPLDVGIIGLGLLGTRHAHQLAKDPRTRIVALTDLAQDRRDKLAHALAARAYADYNDMLRHEHLDLVVVATPDSLHRDPIVSAAQAATPYIVTEKPLATSLADAQAIAAAVSTAKATLMVNFDNRSAPLDVAMRAIVQSGLLGAIVYGDSHLDDNISVPTRMWGDASRVWRMQSSPAHFLLSHIVDLVSWYMEPDIVIKVQAIRQKRVIEGTVDMYDSWLTFRSGAIIRVKSEWNRHMEELVTFSTSVTGTTGGAVYHKLPEFGARSALRACFAEASLDDVRELQERLTSKGIRARMVRRFPRPDVSENGPTMNLELEPLDQVTTPKNLLGYFLDAIEEQRAIPTSWEGNGSFPYLSAGLDQVRVIQALIEAAETGHDIALQ